MAASLDQFDPYRLPLSARPRRYDVRLRPDLASATFTGAVRIEVDVDESLDHLVLNAIELSIEHVEIDGHATRHELDEATERLVVLPDHPIEPGGIVLSIDFEGTINDKLRGFYRSTYTDEHGEEQVIATTQMQSTDCRRAFPCWDEPEFKAVFGITLDVESGLTAVSNGAETTRVEEGPRTVIRFADTMVMSSYLVAFVVGRLETTAPVDVDGIPVRVIHVPGKGHLTDFAVETAAFCIRWFQDYYDIPYPSDKIDLLALPDFAAGAMENLGCITFRESLLLIDLDTSTQTEQQRVVDVVAHELAHMWFGDLVTMRWWNGIWLNEAFATFMEVAACAAFKPDWQRWTFFGVERSAAFAVDSLASTRSVEFEVHSPAESEGMFDVLTYQKGGALLRMLEQYLGEERFRDGIRLYLRRHSYANTETNDLWDAIEESTGEPVRRIMDSWIWQPGFPLVSARLDGTDLVLTQRRFRYSEPSGDADAATWAVPVGIGNGGAARSVLVDAEPVRVPLADPTGAVVVNAGGSGFYRVSYDEALRAHLSGDALQGLSVVERYGLVDDAWAATLGGRMSAPEMLDFLRGFGQERDQIVWSSIAVALRGLSRLVDGDALVEFRRVVRDLVGPPLADLGEPHADEPDLDAKLRGLLTGLGGVLGQDPATIARGRELFDAAAADPTTVDAELVAAATSIVAATGDEADFERMLDGFRHGSTPQEQLRHLMALAEFDDADLIGRTCAFALSGEVKTQTAPFLLNNAISNRNHGWTAWEIVRNHWEEANDRFPTNTIVRMVGSVPTLDRPEQVADVAGFFAEHPIPQAAKTLEQVLERQRVNAALRARDADPLAASLIG